MTTSDRHDPSPQLQFRQLPHLYAVVHLDPNFPVPIWATNADFTSITRTAEELSIVCPMDNLPADMHSQHRWICLKLEGPFAFSQTGILLSFIEALSNNGVPIFAISTFETDYVLVPEAFAGQALQVLTKAGHEFLSL
ncbi:MAG: ACT domain-containing protein [Candidatus Sulfotelmatobacter sp.]